MKRSACFLIVCLINCISLIANTSTSIVGRATSAGTPLAGVTVTASSPSMQGTQSTETDVNGRYAFLALPPGDYKVTFALDGMQHATTNVRAGVGQTARADAAML